MIEVGDTVSGIVEKLVFGGQGLIRYHGWVIFVADVAVGEEVEVVITQKKKSYFQAKLLQVIAPSPMRTVPPCPYFGTCGGCQLQHLVYEEQLRLKVQWLVEALERIGKIQIDFPIAVQRAKKEWGYRRKVTLHGHERGFYARDNITIIPIERCLIFSDKSLPKTNREATKREVAKEKGTKKEKLVVMRDANDQFLFDANHPLEIELAGLRVSYSADVFMQNDPEQALQIYRDILENIERSKILDLYCGIGIFSLLAAKLGCQVVGVELNAQAIAFAKKNAKENAISNAQFYAMPCEKIRSLDIDSYGVWIVNPPRTGLSQEVIQIVHQMRPAQLVYISCMPATLARDLKQFNSYGYKIQQAEVYDMFSQTTHLETVVYLSTLANVS